MERQRHGRDTWAQFDDPITVSSNREVVRADENSFRADSSVTSVLRIGQLGGTTDDRGSFCSSGPTSDAYLPLSIHQVSQLAPMQSQLNSSESSVTCTDPWSISPEQRAYYLSQFLRLQSDPRGKLSGSQAKLFFELSKLPTAELSDIWELSDVDHDGQLTLGEFAVAMHLVVLRRNGVPVPQTLPKTLVDVIANQSLFTSVSAGKTHVDTTDSGSQDHHRYAHPIVPNVLHSIAVLGVSGAPAPPPPPPTFGNRPWPVSPTCSSISITPVSLRQRRWSISSQSDISSLAEGIMHFEARPNADGHLQYPIPLRARTLPSGCSAPNASQNLHSFDLSLGANLPMPPSDSIACHEQTGDFSHSNPNQPSRSSIVSVPPPPPPPRAYAVGKKLENPIATAATSTRVDPVDSHQLRPTDHHCPHHDDNITTSRETRSSPVVPVEKKENYDDVFVDPTRVPRPTESRGKDADSLISQLQRECDAVMQNNDRLTSDLMQLQQQRIALKILLERLMPLEAAGCPS